MDRQTDATPPINIFYSYTSEDERFAARLETHLSLLRQQGIISTWHHLQLLAGSDRAQITNQHLNTASIILLLISPDFLASDYCYSVEMQTALEREASGNTLVIPILLRPVDWEDAPFAHLQCLPHNSKPVTSWHNQDEAFLDVAKGIRAIVKNMYDTDRVNSLLPSPLIITKQVPTTQEGKKRQRLLKRVRDIWISGVLEQSLHNAAHNAAFMILGLHEQSDTIINPWRLAVQETDRPSRLLPSGTRITQVYNDADGELLILGEPGSGKTTLLLDLTRNLLSLAEQDQAQPIPLVCNLSSWAEKRLPLSIWLIEELEVKYQVSRTIGTKLVHTEQFILLLDGLDEVADAHRSACVNAINAYRREHDLVPVVVCSRKTEYQALQTSLSLYKSVIVQPLTLQQIDEYLAAAGKEAEIVRTTLHSNPDLLELATAPLMLNILLRVYQGKTSDDLTTIDSTETKQLRIFRTYVQSALKRRGIDKRYTIQQTEGWLVQLAQHMRPQNQSVFYLEKMQPNWLPTRRWYQIYELLAVRLPDALIGALVSIMIANMFSNTISNLFSTLLYGVFGGLLGVLSSRKLMLITIVESSTHTKIHFWDIFLQMRHLRCGLIVGPIYWLIYWWYYGLSIGLIYGLVFGLVSILLSVLLENRPFTHPFVKLPAWSLRNLLRNLINFGFLWIGLITGLCYASGYVISTILVNLNKSPTSISAFTLVYVVNYTLIGILINALFVVRKPLIEPAEIISWSWRKLWGSLLNITSLRNGLLIGLFVGAIAWLIYSLLGTQVPIMWASTPRFSLSAGVIFGLNYWLLFALFKGLSSDTLGEHYRSTPNEGILRSGRNSIFIGLSSALTSVVVYSVSYGSVDMLIYSWSHTLLLAWSHGLLTGLYVGERGLGLDFGLSIGLLCMFLNGGLAYIQHYILRLLLWRTRSIPLNYARFLDYADSRILLRKVAGGYSFIHPLFLEYFAQYVTNTQQQKLPNGEDH